MSLDEIARGIDEIAAETSFSGAIALRVEGRGHCAAFGERDRANRDPITPDTRFATASGTKGFTALGIAALVGSSRLEFDTPAASILGDVVDVDPRVTIRHLLGHTSGIGDYLDEEAIDDVEQFFLPVPVRSLESPLDYAALIAGKPPHFSPGERFRYSNSGYVLLAMIVEIVAQRPYHEFVEESVFRPAGMARSGYFRSDRLPENTAIGYVRHEDSWRTNVHHLPVIGGGDGGAYSTLEDMDRFWAALKAARIVGRELTEELLGAHIAEASSSLGYGYGFWIDERKDHVVLEGHDAGVSFRSSIARTSADGYTVLSNTSSGARPLIRLLEEQWKPRVDRVP